MDLLNSNKTKYMTVYLKIPYLTSHNCTVAFSDKTNKVLPRTWADRGGGSRSRVNNTVPLLDSFVHLLLLLLLLPPPPPPTSKDDDDVFRAVSVVDTSWFILLVLSEDYIHVKRDL